MAEGRTGEKRWGVGAVDPMAPRDGDLPMELRLGDLYDLVVRIVDERLRRWRLNGSKLTAGDAETNAPPPSRSEGSQLPSEWHTLTQQLSEIATLQRQVLAALLQHQQRTEALLDEMAGMLAQLPKNRPDSGHLPMPHSDERDTPPTPRTVDTTHHTEKLQAPSFPRTPSVEPAIYTPPTVATASPVEQVDGTSANWADLFVTYLQHTLNVQIQYLQERPMPVLLEEGGAKVLVGEALRNGQAVTIAALYKDSMTAPDVSIFYNAIVKPLRASVTEPVVGIVIGQRFDPKSERVAYAYELVALTVADLLTNGAAG